MEKEADVIEKHELLFFSFRRLISVETIFVVTTFYTFYIAKNSQTFFRNFFSLKLSSLFYLGAVQVICGTIRVGGRQNVYGSKKRHAEGKFGF